MGMKKGMEGMALLGTFYLLTLWLAFLLYSVFYHEPFDHDWDASGTFIGLLMVAVPYGVFAWVSASVFRIPPKIVLLSSAAFAILERAAIFLIGLKYAQSGFGAENAIQLIRGEALPYFSPLYMARVQAALSLDADGFAQKQAFTELFSNWRAS